MQIAVLPMNAGPETRATLARQVSNFACEIARNVTRQEIHAVNYLAQFQDEGVNRFAMVNPNEALNEAEMVQQFFQNSPMERLVDGLLVETESGGTLTLRVFQKGDDKPLKVVETPYVAGGIFTAVRSLVRLIVEELGSSWPAELDDDASLFGTSDPTAFTNFLVGFDAVQYIEKAQGMVAREFDPAAAFGSLMSALETDQDWEGPYVAALQLSRLCTQYRIGTADLIEKHLRRLTEIEPDDPRAWYALGELSATIGNFAGATELMEKALVKLQMRAASLRKQAAEAKAAGDEAEATQLANEAAANDSDQGPVMHRLGLAQLQLGMPANAERNFRKAAEFEGPEKPSLDMLANVLTQTGRAHEVPPIWKEVVDAFPQNAFAHAKHALALLNAGNEAEAMRAFDVALETVEENAPVKRFYAPVLAQKGEHDRAMDLYEDVLDVAPADVGVLLEYAQTLQSAGREFEVPKVLKDVLAANPDPNTRANTLAWLIELEQPKRVESVKAASDKLEAGDAEGALKDLRPLRNWLADYWKMWAVLASALNRLEQFEEAEAASKNLLELFPGCEPGYGELATAFSGQGRDQEAYNLLTMALQNMPSSLPIALNLAFAAKRVGSVDEAKNLARQIREATRNQPELGPILDELES